VTVKNRRQAVIVRQIKAITLLRSTYNDAIGQCETCGEGRISTGVSHVPSQGAGPQRS